MSFYDYKASQIIKGKGYPFYALIMAAMRQADTFNLENLAAAFPLTYKELKERYNAPDGLLASEIEVAQ